MAHGAFAEPQGEPAPGHERAGRSHPSGCRPHRGGHRISRRPTLRDRLGECVGRGSEGVKDRLVTRGAPSSPSEAVGCGGQHRAEPCRVEGWRVPGRGPCFEEGGAIEGPGRSPDGGDQSVSDGPQHFAGRRAPGKIREHRVDGTEADHQVVAVVTVAEDRIEPGQVAGMPLDHRTTAIEGSADRDRIDDVVTLG